MKILFTLILQLFLFNCVAQITEDWTFRNSPAWNYYPTTDMVQNDSFTYICSQSIDTDTTAYVFRLDENGNATHSDSIQYFPFPILGKKRMVIDQDGNLYIYSNVLFQSQFIKPRLIKYDSLLNRMWDIILIDTNFIEYEGHGLLYSSLDNSIFIIGTRFDGTNPYNVSIKLNSDGILQRESYDTTYKFIESDLFVLDNSGNVIIGGYASGSGTGEDVRICMFDTAGIGQWYNTYDGSGHDDDGMSGICITPQNNIVTLNRFEDSIPVKIMQFDSFGTLKWTTSIPNISFSKIAGDNTGSIYIVGFSDLPKLNYNIMKFDSTGAFINSDSSNFSNHIYYAGSSFVDIKLDDSTNIFVLNNIDSLGEESKWALVKFDSSLHQKFAFVYADSIPNPSTASSLLINEKGFIIAGAINNYSELRVVQFKETFNVGITLFVEHELITYWPNPGSDNLFFTLNKNYNGKVDFKIYDVQMKNVLHENIIGSNIEENKINIKSLIPGVYFFTFHLEGKYGSGRFIKL
jgi:hypothetical protein